MQWQKVAVVSLSVETLTPHYLKLSRFLKEALVGGVCFGKLASKQLAVRHALALLKLSRLTQLE